MRRRRARQSRSRCAVTALPSKLTPPPCRRQEAERELGGGRLSAAGFADDAQRAAALQREADAVDRNAGCDAAPPRWRPDIRGRDHAHREVPSCRDSRRLRRRSARRGKPGAHGRLIEPQAGGALVLRRQHQPRQLVPAPGDGDGTARREGAARRNGRRSGHDAGDRCQPPARTVERGQRREKAPAYRGGGGA